jgi:uncharacterized membrane protein YjjP (DUF1212 family)
LTKPASSVRGVSDAGDVNTMEQTTAKAFVLELGVALHAYGTPAHRLESALAAVAERLGLQAQVFTTPTQLMIGFGAPVDQKTTMARVQPGDVDLEKLASLDALADAVVRGEVDLEAGRARIKATVDAPPRYGSVTTVIAFGLVSAAVARFFGGSAYDMAASGAIGLCTGLLAVGLTRSAAGARVFELVAAFVAAAAAHCAQGFGLPVSASVATLAGLIVLIPGLTLTVAMTEVATRNLVAGTARLTAAVVVFLEIAFGAALGERVVAKLVGVAESAQASSLPGWTEPVVLIVSTLAIAVLFRAHPRASLSIVVAGCSGFYGARLGAWLLGPALGACVGAFVVGVGSNAYARITDKPAMVPMTPGILLLVPGSLGFRSLSSLMQRDVVTGIDTAFTMVVVATSLVAGLLVANATVSPRRNL